MQYNGSAIDRKLDSIQNDHQGSRSRDSQESSISGKAMLPDSRIQALLQAARAISFDMPSMRDKIARTLPVLDTVLFIFEHRHVEPPFVQCSSMIWSRLKCWLLSRLKPQKRIVGAYQIRSSRSVATFRSQSIPHRGQAYGWQFRRRAESKR